MSSLPTKPGKQRGAPWVVLLVGLVAGCGDSVNPPPAAQAVVDPDSSAESATKARAALLDLMTQADSPFEGAAAARFAEVPLTRNSRSQFSWGAFTIDLDRRTYQAVLSNAATTTFYDGTFRVNEGGDWKADFPERSHAHEPRESNGEAIE